MGSSPTKLNVTISNAYHEDVHVFKTLDTVPFNHFLLSYKEKPFWYTNVHGTQRIARGDSVTLQFELPTNTCKVFFSIGTESGFQISESLERDADCPNLIITQGGSAVNAKPKSMWTDLNNKSHRPANNNKCKQPDKNGKTQPNNSSVRIPRTGQLALAPDILSGV